MFAALNLQTINLKLNGKPQIILDWYKSRMKGQTLNE